MDPVALTLLSDPVWVPDKTRRRGLVELPSLRKVAFTFSPELLIASLSPATVSFEESIVMVAEVPPATITIVPWVTAPLVDEKPSETSFVSRARLLTVKEKVPEVAWLLVLKLATEFVSVALLLKKLLSVDKNFDSVFRVVTTLLKV